MRLAEMAATPPLIQALASPRAALAQLPVLAQPEALRQVGQEIRNFLAAMAVIELAALAGMRRAAAARLPVQPQMEITAVMAMAVQVTAALAALPQLAAAQAGPGRRGAVQMLLAALIRVAEAVAATLTLTAIVMARLVALGRWF
jgi:hypothetical protein